MTALRSFCFVARYSVSSIKSSSESSKNASKSSGSSDGCDVCPCEDSLLATYAIASKADEKASLGE